jgi:ABC-type protease/lipase transport system fused ATPase/permease subunit
MTYVGEQGLHLSATQKTKLALARLLVSNPKVVIFDVDAALESETDDEFRARVLEAISKMAHAMVTVIVVSTRQELIDVADVVCSVGET